jgi:hypothetical protein
MGYGFQLKNADGIQIVDEDYYSLGFSRKIPLSDLFNTSGLFNGLYPFKGESQYYWAIGPVSKLPAYFAIEHYETDKTRGERLYAPTGADLSQLYVYVFRDTMPYTKGYGIQLKDQHGATRFMSWLKPVKIIDTCLGKYPVSNIDADNSAVMCNYAPSLAYSLSTVYPSNVASSYYFYLWPTLNKASGNIYLTPNCKGFSLDKTIAYKTYPTSKIHLPNYLPFLLIDTSIYN